MGNLIVLIVIKIEYDRYNKIITILNKQTMSEDLEKQTMAALGGATGEIPTTIKLLAIALDKTFMEMNVKHEARHDQIVNLLIGHKTNIEKDFGVCRGDVKDRLNILNERVDKLKWISFISENPKTAAILILGLLTLIGSGVENILTAIL